MKLGIVTEYYYPYLGGISEHVHNTYIHFKRRGITVKIIAPRLPDLAKNWPIIGETAPKSDIIRAGLSLPFYNNGGFVRFTSPIGLWKRMRKIYNEENFDLIHVHSPMIPFLPMVAIRTASCPVVGTFHTIFTKTPWYNRFRKKCGEVMAKIDVKLSVSPQCAKAMGQYFDFDCTIIPNGVDTELYNPSAAPVGGLCEDGQRNILFLGRLDPHNGLDILLRAFKKVRREVANARVIVVGTGPLARCYKKMAGQFGSAVHFAGPQHRLKPNYYRTASVFCNPASLHGFSIVNMEAMASGVPVVASDIAAFKWSMDDSAIYFPSGDADSLAVRLIGILKDDKARMEAGRKARLKALDFSWNKVCDKILEKMKGVVPEV